MTCFESKLVLLVGNDLPVYFNGVQDAAGEYRSDAVVTADLLDSNGATVVSGITLSYLTGSSGRYRGTIQSSVSLTAGAEYTLILLATIGGDFQTRIDVPCIALNRNS
jgi:hypothetical protein